MLNSFFAMFFAKAALLYAAERQLIIDNLRRVDPGVASFDALGASHGPIDVARPDGRAQTENRIVRLLDRLVEALYAHNRQSRAKALFLQEARCGVDISNESRLQVITFVILLTLGSLGTVKHLGAAVYGIFHLLFDFLPLFGRVQWTHQSAGLQAIANA